jgi:hypothetical protein
MSNIFRSWSREPVRSQFPFLFHSTAKMVFLCPCLRPSNRANVSYKSCAVCACVRVCHVR